MLTLPISPAFSENNLAITMQTSDFFAPYASVVALSIVENISQKYNYDIIFLTWDMREETERKLLTLAEDISNVSIRVVNVREKLDGYKKIAQTSSGFDRFSYTGMIRLLLPQLLDGYHYILNLDCDMLFFSDVSEILEYDISNCYMGAVPDVFCYVINHRPNEDRYSDEHMLKRLGLRSAAEYMNGGFLYLNLQLIRENFTTDQILNFAVRDGVILRCFEQDVFSGLFQDRKLVLPFEWNWFNDMPRLVGENRKFISADDAHINSHRQAEAHIKCIHYVTDKKPWLTNTAYPHTKEWWAVALNSPFLNDIIARATVRNLRGANEIVMRSNTRILFYCASGYQLLNILNIKYHYYNTADADVILSGNKISNYKNSLGQTGVFRNVFTFDDGSEKVRDILPADISYTDFYIPDSVNAGAQSVFIHIAKTGHVAVHLYEGGGCGVYILNYFQQKDFFSDDMLKCVKDIYLYNLETHGNGTNPFPLLPIPLIDREKDRFVTILRQIFGKCSLPEEKYIFLQECFAEEGLACDDSRLLNAAAEIVGKENIAVQLHPKAAPINKKLYQLHGYRTYSNDHALWEFAALQPELENKVLLSISSTALVSPYLVCGSGVRAVSLFDLMPLSRRISDANQYRRFLSNLWVETSKKRATFFCPKSMAELRAVLHYIEGDM